MDFSKLVEVFDQNGVTFVSGTQSFNTTTSIGRLTLNILLSFAQFERDVTAERIRDKVRASRMKGMWMGGCPPLGYEVKARKLVENPADAAHVGWVFARFIEIGSSTLLTRELAERGVTTTREERRKPEADRRHWEGRLTRLERELREEADQGAARRAKAQPGRSGAHVRIQGPADRIGHRDRRTPRYGRRTGDRGRKAGYVTRRFHRPLPAGRRRTVFTATDQCWSAALGCPCPWCGTAFKPSSFSCTPNMHAPTNLEIRCVNTSCDFSRNRPLPVLTVDEPIYLRLPAFLIATVYKFAASPWVCETGAFFGRVDRFQNDVGFYGAAEPGQEAHQAMAGRWIRPISSFRMNYTLSQGRLGPSRDFTRRLSINSHPEVPGKLVFAPR
jgi:hypothetical protein